MLQGQSEITIILYYNIFESCSKESYEQVEDYEIGRAQGKYKSCHSLSGYTARVTSLRALIVRQLVACSLIIFLKE